MFTEENNTNIWGFIIPGRPYTKKNHQVIKRNWKTGTPFIDQNDKYKVYERSASMFAPVLMIDFPVNVKAVYYMPTKAKVDLANLHEALCDILVRGGTIVDDNWKIVHSLDGSYIDFDKKDPRIEVTITRIRKELP